MIICFVETEETERSFFKEALPEHEVRIVASLEDVEPDVEALSIFIYSRITPEFLDAHPNLRLIATRSTGYDHIEMAACRERGVTVSTVPSYGDNTVAEHTFALLLALSRRLRESMGANKGGRFSFESVRGFDLNQKTIGIVGSGRIGSHAIRIAKAFNMNVIAYDLVQQPFMADLLGFEYVPLDVLLARSDIISLHIPLMPATTHLLNRETFAKCKDGVVIINTARGGLIDTEALIEALDSGKVSGAGLDVLEEEHVFQKEAINIIGDQIVSRLQAGVDPEELRATESDRIDELQRLIRNTELINRTNVVFTPHTAFNSVEAVGRINATTVENLRSFDAGKPINVVS
jgi:D-lactate dehydrogenase